MNAKSTPSVKQATEQAFKSLPDFFRGNDLHKVVKLITRRRKAMDGTTMKKLRELRFEKKLNYEVPGDPGKSLYHKLPC